MKEEWKVCIRNKNYKVSNFGKVKRIKKRRGAVVGRILRPAKNSDGYLYVVLNDMGGETVAVHTLVAEIFIGPCPKGKEVNHIDENKKNNYYRNLEYVSHSINMKKSCEGTNRNKGSKNPRSKLNELKVRKIRKLYKTGNYFQRELAEIFKISIPTINNVINYRTW